MAMAPAFGLLELLILLLMGGPSLTGSPLGMPPGAWDEALPRTPPAGCVLYVDWASRGPGTPRGPGIEGFVADPEVQAFVAQVEHAFRDGFDQHIPNEQERAAANAAVNLVLELVQRPGCLFVSFDVDDLPPREDFPNFALLFERLKVGLVVQTASESDTVQKALTTLLASAGIELPESLDRFVLPVPVPGGGITLHRAGERFIVCYGAGTLDVVLEGLADERQGIIGEDRIMSALDGVSVDRPGQRTWVNVAAVIQAADRIAGGQAMIIEAIDPLGLNAVQHFAATYGVDSATGQIVSRMHLATDGSNDGLLALFTGRPMTPEDFAHIPADADFMVGKSLNAQQLLDTAREIVIAMSPDASEEFDEGLAQLEEELGLSIRDDLFDAFGDVWTLYDAPSNGGVILSAPVLCLEVRDYELASAAILKLMQAFEQNLHGEQLTGGRRSRGVFLASHAFEVGENRHVIAFVNITGQGDEPMAPAICLTKTHLLVALHPQELKGHLRFVGSGGKAASLNFGADHPVRTRKVMYYNRIDTAAAGRYLVALLPYFGQMIASELQGEKIAIDLFAVPSARGVLPYLAESTTWIEAGPEGIMCGCRNGIPIPGFAGSFTTLPAMLFSVRSVGIRAAPVLQAP